MTHPKGEANSAQKAIARFAIAQGCTAEALLDCIKHLARATAAAIVDVDVEVAVSVDAIGADAIRAERALLERLQGVEMTRQLFAGLDDVCHPVLLLAVTNRHAIETVLPDPYDGVQRIEVQPRG